MPSKKMAKKKATKDQRALARERALLRSRALLLLQQGVARARIAEQLGVVPATVTRWLKESGIAPVNEQRRQAAMAKMPATLEIKDIPIDHYERHTEAPEVNEFADHLGAITDTLPPDGDLTQLEARDEEEHAIAEVAENQAAPADKYQAFVAATALRIFRDSIPHIRGPRTIKEMSELDQMIRRNLGLNPRGGGANGGSVRIDISILNNTKADLGGSAIAQRVVDAEVVNNSDSDDDEDEDY